MRRFDEIRAAYVPMHRHDLRAGSIAFIGRAGTWQASWIIEDGPYAGQWAMATEPGAGWPFGWAPLCDLREEVKNKET